MPRLVQTVRAIRTWKDRERVFILIKGFGNVIQETRVKEDDFNGLVNHIVEVNCRIQKIMWRGGLFTHIEKYKTLKSTLKFPNHQGILDSVWNSYPYESKRTYIRLVLDFILAYVNWIASKTHSLAYRISIRKGMKPMAGIPFFPKFKYELPLEIKIKLMQSIPVHQMHLP